MPVIICYIFNKVRCGMMKINENNNNECTTDKCKGYCPSCGSDLYFAKDGCYCKGSFKQNSDCDWICTNCTPRVAVSK